MLLADVGFRWEFRSADAPRVSESKRKRARLGEMLVAARAIDPAQLSAALEEQKRSGGLLGMAMLRLGIVDERTLVRALAGQLKLPVVQLQGKQISTEVLDLVPVEIVEKHRCLPLLINGEGESRTLYLGMEDPSDPDVVAEICALVGMNVRAVLVAPTDLDEGVFRHYRCKGFGSELLSLAPSNPQRDSVSALSPGAQMLDPNAADMQPARRDDVGPEPSFVSVNELAFDHPDRPLEFADSPALPRGTASAKSPGGASASSDAMLRAIAQLLVQKGVFTRDELVEQVRAMSKTSGSS